MNNGKAIEMIREIVVGFASKNGISLRAMFAGDEAKFAGFLLALGMKVLTEEGVSTQDAMDTILGSGAYQAMADKVWSAATLG